MSKKMLKQDKKVYHREPVDTNGSVTGIAWPRE